MKYLDDVMENHITMFAEETTMGGIVSNADGSIELQRDINRLRDVQYCRK